MHKIISIFLALIHFSIVLSSGLQLFHQGFVQNETNLCYLVAPLNVQAYISINCFLMVYFLVQFFQANQCKTENTAEKWVICLALILFCLCSVALKFATHWVCNHFV